MRITNQLSEWVRWRGGGGGGSIRVDFKTKRPEKEFTGNKQGCGGGGKGVGESGICETDAGGGWVQISQKIYFFLTFTYYFLVGF